MQHTHAAGESFSLDDSTGMDEKTGLMAKVTQVQVTDDISLLDLQTGDEDLRNETDENGNIKPALIQYIKKGNMDSLSEAVKTRKVPQKLVYVTVDYTNTGDRELKDVLFFGTMERKESIGGDDEPIEDPGNSGGSGSSGGGGSDSGSGGSSSTTGTVTTDSKKGQVNSITGIITGSGDGYSKWIAEAPQAGGADTRWKLQYADGTFAAGFYVTDEQGNLVKDQAGNPVEQPLWEMVNGAWYAFGADGYVRSGLVFDPALNGWFYQDVNTGMKTGWQQIGEKWYYFNPVSDGAKGIMYVSRKTPDGYQVLEDGSWDGQGR